MLSWIKCWGIDSRKAHPAKSTLAGLQHSSPDLEIVDFLSLARTFLEWITRRKNAICIMGIKVNVLEKQTVLPSSRKWTRVTAPLFVKAWLCTVLQQAVCLKSGARRHAGISAKMQGPRNLNLDTRWFVWKDTLAEKKTSHC